MKVLVSTLGRSHFIQVASSLIASGLDVILYQGWIVKKPERSLLLRICAILVGRKSLIYGFTKRMTPELEGRNVGDFWAEFLQKSLVFTFGRLGYWPFHFSNKVGFWVHGWRTRSVLAKGGFDIFHVKSGLGAGGAIECAKKQGVKVLVDHSAGAPRFVVETVDGRAWSRTSYWYTVMKDCEKADLLMVDCDWVKHTFMMYGYPEEKIRVVYMGLDSRFNGLKDWNEDMTGVGRDSPLRIVFSGPFYPHKGNRYFMGAIERLLALGCNIMVDVIGSTSIPLDVANECPEAMKRIVFHGHVPQDEMCGLMKRSHVYLFPSLSEGCAKSAFEAMSMGLCVVATRETGLPMKDGHDGYLIEARSCESIVSSIMRLITRPELIASAGRNAAATLKQYTWDRYASEVEDLYNELWSERGSDTAKLCDKLKS